MKKIILLACFHILFVQNNYAQKIVQYFGVFGTVFTSNNIDFNRTETNQAAGYTTVADIGNYALLYYNHQDGKASVVDRTTLLPKPNQSSLQIEKDWSSIVKLNKNRILFYNKTSGRALIKNNINFNTIEEPGFSPWTHITPINNDLLCFYNDQTGMALVTDMNFKNISPVKNLEKGYTHITDIDNNNILFYNTNTGNNYTYKINLALIADSKKGFSTGWTSIVNTGNNKILFYNYNNSVAVVLDNNLSNQINLAAVDRSKVIIAYDNSTSFQDQMNMQQRFVGGTISGKVSLPQEVLQNSTIWADYKIELYEVIDAPNDITKYKLGAKINIANTATNNDLPAGSNAYDIPYKFTRLPFNKRFIVVFGNVQDLIAKADLRKPLYIAVEIQRNFNLLGAYFTNTSDGCRDCYTPYTSLINANDNRVKICTKAVPDIVNDIEMIK